MFSLRLALVGLSMMLFCRIYGDEPSYLSEYHFDDRLNTIKKYTKDKSIFIETGTAGGGGIYMALLSGFQKIYSVELFPHSYQVAKHRFKEDQRIHIELGDSADYLKRLLPTIHEPVLFWLDAHYSGEGSAKHEYEKVPIIRELRAIAEHPIKTHTILIDDVRCFGTSEFDGITLEEVVVLLKKINPKYEILREDGWIKDDVLVAHIPY